jgi:hypothetical protein
MSQNYSNLTQKQAIGIMSKAAGNTASIRTETISSSAKWNSAAEHNLRATMAGCVSSMSDKGILTYDGITTPKPLDNHSSEGKAKAQLIKSQYKSQQALHSVLVKENGTKNTRFNNPELNGSSKDIRQSFAESVLYFGKDQKDTTGSIIKESHLNKLIELHGEEKTARNLLILARNSMETIAKKYNFELIGDASLHLDEQGQIHVHQLHTNFNKDTGASPNFAKKIGAEMQSIVAQEFKQAGFKRGIPYAIQKIAGVTPQGNIPIRAYKELQEKVTEIEQLQLASQKALKASIRKTNSIENKLKKTEIKLLEKDGIFTKGKKAYLQKQVATLTTKLTAATLSTQSLITDNELLNNQIKTLEANQEQHDSDLKKVASLTMAKAVAEAQPIMDKVRETAIKDTRKAIKEITIEPLESKINSLEKELTEATTSNKTLEDKLILSQIDGRIHAENNQKFTKLYGTHEWQQKTEAELSADGKNLLNFVIPGKDE